MLTGKYLELYNRLKPTISEERLMHDPLRTLAFGTDASFYRLLPKLVIKVETEEEMARILANCYELNIAVTFRAAGTSLSGQAVTDSVLLVLGPSWNKIMVDDDGKEISMQTGVIGAKANQVLAPYDKKLGPDPASVNSAKIGGIVANNASGMTSGTGANSYYSLTGSRLIFNDGTLLDTRDAGSRNAFTEKKGELLTALAGLSKRVKENAEMSARIKKKFEIKNTTGYAVNALIDFEDPIDILEHLMVGSEGTLAFISEVRMRTVDNPPRQATSLMFFPDIEKACEAIVLLRECTVHAAELIDRTSLRSVQNSKAMPAFLKQLGKKVTALLVETRAYDTDSLDRQIREIRDKFQSYPLERPIEFTTDPSECAALWNVRKGLFPSACSTRKKGTTVIIEDIAVPYKHLKDTLVELQKLFEKYTYDNTIIWGHAFDGNIHFVLTLDFSITEQVARYRAFMEDLVVMVIHRFNGSLKAEHGTGRNMAPFVATEWGNDIYAVMKELKTIFDKESILNPGVLINDDPDIYVKNFKPMPLANSIIDDCIECGFCEVNCVSKDLTLSPRQRIVVHREITSLQKSGREPQRLAMLLNNFAYQGDATCATDGLCAISCPVDIDTGKLVKELRQKSISPGAHKRAVRIASHMKSITAVIRFVLNLVHVFHFIFGKRIMQFSADLLRKISGNTLPRWNPYMPRGAKPVSPRHYDNDNVFNVVYFPSCITRTMGVSRDYDEKTALTAKTESLLHKAGFEIIYPHKLDSLCCGMAFSSKGYKEAGAEKARELSNALLKASNNGEIPVLCDMSPCLYTMKETLDTRLKLYEPIEFTLKFLTPYLRFHKQKEPVSIFSVCSAKKMELESAFKQLAEMCAETVIVNEANCCGFAGDRGFSYPELNEDGLKNLKGQIPENCREGYSTSRTCEIGLSLHGGITYKSILYLVDRCTTPKETD